MDIQKIVSDVVARLTGNSDLIAKFTSDPGAIIKQITGLDINTDQIKQVVEGVTKKLGIDAGDAINQGKGILDKIKGIFNK